MSAAVQAPLCPFDHRDHQISESQRTFRIVRWPLYLRDRTDLVEHDTVLAQHERQRQQCRSGVAVGEGMEEADIQIDAGSARRDRDLVISAVGQAFRESGGRVRMKTVKFPAALGERGTVAERCGSDTQDGSLPPGEQVEIQDLVRGSVAAHLFICL